MVVVVDVEVVVVDVVVVDVVVVDVVVVDVVVVEVDAGVEVVVVEPPPSPDGVQAAASVIRPTAISREERSFIPRM